jgi:threonine dehydratase
MFPIAQKFVSAAMLVTDDAIAEAQQALWKVLRIVAEPGGAAAFAALLSGRYKPQPGERVGILVCGGNTTAVDFVRSATAVTPKKLRQASTANAPIAAPIKGD